MKIGENIKRIRIAKKLSQKEVISVANLDSAQYSCIENGKTDPTVTTLEKIAKSLGVSLSDLFASTDELKEINSYDKSIMEKVALLEALSDNEKQTIYTMLDTFIGKQKLKDALSGVLNDVKKKPGLAGLFL
ncbi:helix-turn-helix transcriptional regulator [Schleiferia thermophila]|uniref:helix-turn-helix domain-containing protein n=1 Tax=Schleiferia thermophila TaxID=884107 RepID=UPI002FDB9434